MDFTVSRSDLRSCKFVPSSPPESLGPDEVLIEIDRFAFTANNVTYAVAGDMMSYWDFFPADEGWGRIPVWGYGDVARSNHADVPEGERVYGYLPMSTHVVVKAGHVRPQGFRDEVPHRAARAAVYNGYDRVAADPRYEPKLEDATMLFRPLFTTSFLIQDLLAEEQYFGADSVVLSSASSKTSLSLAFLLSRTSGARPQVVGLTSASNRAFVEGLGCYDRVVVYDDVASLPSDASAAFVDMAGNGEVLGNVHRHFGDQLVYSCGVGITHWEHAARPTDLPGATPAFFFAPDRVQKRNADWGAEGFAARLAEAWQPFVASADGWIRVTHGRGTEAVEHVYRETLEGRSKPDEGHVLSLKDGPGDGA